MEAKSRKWTCPRCGFFDSRYEHKCKPIPKKKFREFTAKIKEEMKRFGS